MTVFIEQWSPPDSSIVGWIHIESYHGLSSNSNLDLTFSIKAQDQELSPSTFSCIILTHSPLISTLPEYIKLTMINPNGDCITWDQCRSEIISSTDDSVAVLFSDYW